LICAVPEEARATVRRLGPTRKVAIGPYPNCVTSSTGAMSFTAIAAGFGEAAAATATATALSVDPSIDLVINTGIAGGFAPRIGVGQVVIADHILAADLGAEDPGSPGARVRLSAMGYEGGEIECDATLVRRAAAITHARVGMILTVSTITASQARLNDFIQRHPQALAEAMEGHGVAVAAKAHGKAFLELRAISNPVGVRDIGSWSMDEALVALSDAVYALLNSPDSHRLLQS